MKFAEFMTISYNIIGGDKKDVDFLLELIDAYGGFQEGENPLYNIKNWAIKKYYIRTLPKKHANTILKKKQEIDSLLYYLKKKKKLKNLYNALKQKEPTLFENINANDNFDNEKFITEYSKLFDSIITDCATVEHKRKKRSKKTEAVINSCESSKDSAHFAETCEASLAIPNECYICLYCEYWKGNVSDGKKYSSGVLGLCKHYPQLKATK